MDPLVHKAMADIAAGVPAALPDVGCPAATREHVIRILETAFACARRAHDGLEETTLLAHLPHRRRSINRVEHMTAAPGEGLLAQEAIDELDLLIRALDAEVEKGTSTHWIGSEYDDDSGYTETFHEPRVRPLIAPLGLLRALRAAIAAVQDALAAVRLAGELMG